MSTGASRPASATCPVHSTGWSRRWDSIRNQSSIRLEGSEYEVSVVLEDNTKFAAFKAQNPNANLVALNVPPPQVLISTYGYSYARYGLRKSDCTLNFAYTRALAELRTNGTIPTILRKWGLNPHNNLFIPGTF